MSRKNTIITKHHEFMDKYFEKRKNQEKAIRRLKDERAIKYLEKERELNDVNVALVALVSKFADGKFRTAKEMAVGTDFTPQELGCNLCTNQNVPTFVIFSKFKITKQILIKKAVEIDVNGNIVGEPFELGKVNTYAITKRE